jgi:hypothetical protein
VQIEWANRHPAAAEAIGQAGLRFVEQDLSMDRVYDYMLHKFNMYGALQVRAAGRCWNCGSGYFAVSAPS